ncbi:PAS domain S-box protein [Hyphomicrobium methylovorum]|uniref:PAS domain S-box protein n=1 Tax=Hyphomicrobium methylovorum TaxID=84 RepID=UPI0031B5BC62
MPQPVDKNKTTALLQLGSGQGLGEALPFALFTCDLAGVVAAENRQSVALFGPLLDRPVSELNTWLSDNGALIDPSRALMIDVLRTGCASPRRELTLQRPGGQRILLEVHTRPILDPDGAMIGGLCTAQDISDRIAAGPDRGSAPSGSAASESEHNYRQILSGLPVAVFITDAAGKITFFNQAAVALAGREPAPGTACGDAFRLFDLDGVEFLSGQCPTVVALRERRPVTGADAIVERPDGSRARFVAHSTPLFDSHGELYGAMTLMTEVVKRHEDQIQAARLAAIVASSDDAIVSKTLDGYITSWNMGATRIFGYTEDEMIGQHITRIVPPELHSEEDALLARLRAGEHIDHFETVRVGKDGRRIDVSVTISPMRDMTTGHVIGASKVGRDISDRIRFDKLQQLLISELNHRVKNTLATVQSIANQTAHSAKSMTDFAVSFGGRLQALARMHSLLTDSTWQGAELSSIIRDQLQFSGAGEDRISYSGPALVLNSQVALHLALVLHELVTNALKHGALSNNDGKIEIHWVIRSDDGRRLQLQWQELGGPPVTAPAERGFGTTLIKCSLDPHDGNAVVHYKRDGVVCEITLPLPEEESTGGSYAKHGAKVAESSRMTVPKPSGAGPLTGKRILVVDDEPLIAMDIIGNLMDEGCDVIGPAATVEKALDLISGTTIDAALLDANLAGDPVDSLADALRQRGVPFAFVSGYGRENLPEKFRDSELVRKPFQPRVLLDAVRKLLHKDEDNVIPLRLNI